MDESSFYHLHWIRIFFILIYVVNHINTWICLNINLDRTLLNPTSQHSKQDNDNIFVWLVGLTPSNLGLSVFNDTFDVVHKICVFPLALFFQHLESWWPVWLLFDFRWDGQWRSICRRRWGEWRRRRRRRRSTGLPRSACIESPSGKKYIIFQCCTSTCHVLAEGPIVGEDVDEGEGHGEGAEEDVGDGQVRDEDVSGGQHCLIIEIF